MKRFYGSSNKPSISRFVRLTEAASASSAKEVDLVLLQPDNDNEQLDDYSHPFLPNEVAVMVKMHDHIPS